jgi:hypothetical protein
VGSRGGSAWGWDLAQLRGGDTGGHGSSVAQDVGIPPCVGLAWGCGLAQPEEQRAQQNGAVSGQAYRVGIWQAGSSFIRLWHGEAFPIYGFRVSYFWLSLVLYLSQACLQLLGWVSGSGAHQVCSCLCYHLGSLTFIFKCIFIVHRVSPQYLTCEYIVL